MSRQGDYMKFGYKILIYIAALAVCVLVGHFVFDSLFNGVLVFAVGYFVYTRLIEGNFIKYSDIPDDFDKEDTDVVDGEAPVIDVDSQELDNEETHE